MKRRFIKSCLWFFVLWLVSGSGEAVSSGLVLSEQNKSTILSYARLLMDGRHEEKFDFDRRTREIKNPVIVCLFSESGKLEASQRVDDPKLSMPKKLDRAVGEIQQRLRWDPERIKKAYLHILVVRDTGKFANFGIKGLFDWRVYEPRVTGIIYRLKGRKAEIHPLEGLVKDYSSKKVRSYLAKKVGMDPKNIVRNNDLEIEIYRVTHFGEGYPGRELTTYHRGHKILTSDQVNREKILNSLGWVGHWYKHNVFDGEVTYKYDPARKKYKNKERTMVRSTMAVWVLNKLAYFLNDKELKKLGKVCIDYYLERYFNMEESLGAGRLTPSLIPTEKGEVAANRYTTASFMAMAILAREDEAGQYSRELKLLMDWVMRYQRPDGIFKTEYAKSQYFMPGQLLLAIATFYEQEKEHRYQEYFDRSFDVYARQLNKMMDFGNPRYAPIAPAWFTQPFAKMYHVTKEGKYRDIVYRINDRIVKWYELNAKDISYFDYDGILTYKLATVGNVSVTAASLESLVDAYQTAKIDGDEKRQAAYARVIKQTVAYLMRLQYLPENTYYIEHRDRILGGFKYSLMSNVVWMDNVWHLTSAFIKALQYDLFEDSSY